MKEQRFTKSKDVKLRLHFNLKQMREKERLTQIMLVTTINKQRIRIYTKLRIEPQHWDKFNNRCKTDQPLNKRDRIRLNQINSRLNRLENSIYQEDVRLAEQGKYLSAFAIRMIIANKATDEPTGDCPINYLYQQVEEYLQSLNRRGKRGIASTQKTYYTALKRLEKFCMQQKRLIQTFDDFDKNFFADFTNYLYTCTYQKGDGCKQYTQNTVINTIKVIKNLLHRAYDNEMTHNNYFEKVQTVLPSDVSEKVYLSENEVKKLAGLKLDEQSEIYIRDMFIIACYTALRISDIRNLNEAIIQDGVITLYQNKTKEQVQIPILKEITSLITQYQKTTFPTIDICKANEVIKVLAKRCGICENIHYKEHRGGVVTIKTSPKWEMITFHTARRSCITNLYKRGYPVNYIMTLSGHRSIQAFQRYIRASSKELMTNFVHLLKKEKAL